MVACPSRWSLGMIFTVSEFELPDSNGFASAVALF
tara:strand:+ start:103 stop:207 length:105 start_codon:yes stop_codon:yes gene_type:complete